VIRPLVAAAVVVSALALVACGDGASKSPTPEPPRTPVSPPAFTPTLPMLAARETAIAAQPGSEATQIVGMSFVSARDGWVLRGDSYGV
jgi:hypothetical protein